MKDMIGDFYYDSCGMGRIRARVWEPEGNIRAIVQIVHGIAEHVGRYDAYARWMTKQGFLVVA